MPPRRTRRNPQTQGLLPGQPVRLPGDADRGQRAALIIFTEKEFRVIHGIAIVYLWLIDADAIFLDTLERATA